MCVLSGPLRSHPALTLSPDSIRGVGVGWGRLCFSVPLNSPDHGLQ